ncbi:MAG: HPr family phosphocarrier protein [Dorea sp.]|nr:HPr family phosphocarrier protein [Dorea sp.]
MFEAKVIINNETGLHARPAAELANLSGKFQSDIRMVTDTAEILPKSIISILTAGVFKGTEVKIIINGEDEEEAGKALVNLLNNLPD